jgi:hypothetical protein
MFQLFPTREPLYALHLEWICRLFLYFIFEDTEAPPILSAYG